MLEKKTKNSSGLKAALERGSIRGNSISKTRAKKSNIGAAQLTRNHAQRRDISEANKPTVDEARYPLGIVYLSNSTSAGYAKYL